MLGNRELLGLGPRALREVRGAGIGMVFQEPSAALNPVFRVGRQLAEALRAHRKLTKAQARARAIELLGVVGIPEPERRVDHYPHQLSGGTATPRRRTTRRWTCAACRWTTGRSARCTR
ncbi:hypothetical protein ACWEKJ_39375 [Amycolatopsis thermoflava]